MSRICHVWRWPSQVLRSEGRREMGLCCSAAVVVHLHCRAATPVSADHISLDCGCVLFEPAQHRVIVVDSASKHIAAAVAVLGAVWTTKTGFKERTQHTYKHTQRIHTLMLLLLHTMMSNSSTLVLAQLT